MAEVGGDVCSSGMWWDGGACLYGLLVKVGEPNADTEHVSLGRRHFFLEEKLNITIKT